jgi:PAS domain S-box-containing protein
VPFALLYSVVDSENCDDLSQCSDATPVCMRKSCVLEGSVCVPRGHPISPEKFELRKSEEALVSAFREAIQTTESTMLYTKDGTLPASLLQSIEWRGYEDPCREAMILPLRPTNADNVCALLLLGINPRRAYDQEYMSFMAMLNRQIATSLASVLLFEDEVRRSKHAAEIATMQREQLSQQLQLQSNRMRRMTELSPLGMYLFNPKGRLLEANDRYYEMTGVSKEDAEEGWSIDMMVDTSKKTAQDLWDYITRELKPKSCELQFRSSRVKPRDFSGEPIEYWVLVSSQPELSPDGQLISVMGSITDISYVTFM